MCKYASRPLSYTELFQGLELQAADQAAFNRLLGQLEKQGEVVKTRKSKYGLPSMMNLVRGVISLGAKGFGIVVAESSDYPEVFIYGRDLNGAMHEDKVLVRIMQLSYGQARAEGEVVRVLERAHAELVGTLTRGNRVWQVVPDDERQIYPVIIKEDPSQQWAEGSKVLVRITGWPGKFSYPEGKIIQQFGYEGEPGVALQIVIKKHDLREHFPTAVLQAADQLQQRGIAPKGQEGRRDLRHLKLVTIDGEDAKDLDDAVSLERMSGGYRLGVHIADVSHYVKAGGQLDREAFLRGTSVYLVDKVLPMLPPALSNYLCSLNAGLDRLALSCVMDMDYNGQVISYEIVKSLVNVSYRLNYTQVNKFFADNKDINSDTDLTIMLSDMGKLAYKLRRQRLARGALDFDFPESQVLIDAESGKVSSILRRERGPGELLIEDFMIKANEIVAEHLFKRQLPALYRVHEAPGGDALQYLKEALTSFNYMAGINKLDAQTLQAILQKSKGTPEEQTIAMLILRSMQHAEYLPRELGHFGLGAKFYCHFTSPIRRYPDLLIHRVLSSYLDGSMTGRHKRELEEEMRGNGEQSSRMERRAEEAERELLSLKKAEYMQQFIGDIFVGRISSVHSFGFFVELDNTVEGLVHVSGMMDDYYEFSEQHYTLRGVHSGKLFRIGDEAAVKLVNVSLHNGKIDFELAAPKPGPRKNSENPEGKRYKRHPGRKSRRKYGNH